MKLSDFKDKYKGERCFFIGNGPSINETPLEKLIGEYAFGCNKVADLFGITPWRPTHYVGVTRLLGALPDWQASMVKAIDTGIPCFLAGWLWLYGRQAMGYHEHIDSIKPEWKHPPERSNVIQFNGLKLSSSTKGQSTGFSGDAENVIIVHRSVSLVWIQLATWMGFGPLYLLGCDGGYKPFKRGEPDVNHWNPNYDDFERTEAHCEHENTGMAQAHKEMKVICDKLGVEVYNATVGGELEAYPRVDIHELLDG